VRIAVDTNVLLAAFVARGLCAELLGMLILRHMEGSAAVFVSRQVRAEFRRHLKGKFKASPSEIAAALAVLETFENGSREAALDARAIPDADDVPILAAALAFAADDFVTGDKALLALRRVGPMQVLSPRQMFERLTLSGPGTA
jgi:putative PIN family toxin of toxin-antitoxin system